MSLANELTVRPATHDRWPDLEALFGPNGAAAGCWCRHWQQSSAEWQRHRGAANRAALEASLRSTPAPGLLAYRGGTPVGWCALGPRTSFRRLRRSYVARPIDQRPAWAIVCFYVARKHRRTGVTRALVDAACAFVRDHDGDLLEAYPVDPTPGRRAGADNVFCGLAPVFRRAGFHEVARHKADRPLMRKELGDRQPPFSG